jgi:hypothetical protein
MARISFCAGLWLQYAAGDPTMPLRDYFHPPLSERRSWRSFHAMWPSEIVRRLLPLLPEGYFAEPNVRFGANLEVDVGAAEDVAFTPPDTGGGTATLAAPALAPTWTVEVDLADPDDDEVLVYNDEPGRAHLVAAIEIVSLRNKDRPEARAAFAAKVATLLRRGVCVSAVDLVTSRWFNLYAAALDLMGLADPTLGDAPPSVYAATSRKRTARGATHLDSWFYPLAVGRPLPTIPLWLDDQTRLTVDLEASYEETCRVLRIP